jgi:glycosyltransferase involved in cell wall biosynthesis
MGVRTSGKDLGRYDWTFRFSFWLERLLSRLADLVIINSQAGKAVYLKKGFPAEKMLVISNGIDTQVFHAEAGLGQALRAEWGVAETDVLIGIIGRLDPMKGHAVFLKAAAALDRPDLHVVVVGDGPQAYRQYMVDLGNALGLGKRLVWAASRRDVACVYNALDICCSASIYGEGFPNVVGEAMACGIPCVVTDVGDSAWVAGPAGKVVIPNDCNSLSSALNKMIELSRSERAILGKNGRQRVADNFSVESMVRNTEDALVALVGNEPR